MKSWNFTVWIDSNFPIVALNLFYATSTNVYLACLRKNKNKDLTLQGKKLSPKTGITFFMLYFSLVKFSFYKAWSAFLKLLTYLS